MIMGLSRKYDESMTKVFSLVEIQRSQSLFWKEQFRKTF